MLVGDRFFGFPIVPMILDSQVILLAMTIMSGNWAQNYIDK
jgi:hypothetical protein